MTPEMKELFEERFEHLYEKMDTQFDSIQEKVHDVSKQATDLKLEIHEIKKTINAIILDNARHFIACPNTDSIPKVHRRIDELEKWINEKMQDIWFFTRNPKFLYAVLSAGVFIIFLSIYGVYQKIITTEAELRKFEYFQRQTPQDKEVESIFRGGKQPVKK